MTSKIGRKIKAKSPDVSSSEEEIIGSLDDDERSASARLTNAAAADQEKLTELKEQFAAAILFFLWIWFGALSLVVLTYFSHQMFLEKEIPKEVIISIFTCTAVVVGLVGYILKGLFGTK